MDGLYAGITNDDSGCISASCSVWPGSVATSPHSFRVQSLILSLGYYKTFAAGFLRLSKKNASRWIVYAELWMCVRLINQVVVSRRKRRAVKMMATVVLLFGACWAPFHLVSLLLDYGNTHTHTALIFCYSHTSGPLKACVWCLTLGFELFSTSGQIHAGGNSYNHFMTLIL